MWASDALYGVIYTPEELGSEVAADGTPIITTARAQRTDRPAAAPSAAAAAVSAADIIGATEPVDAETVTIDVDTFLKAIAAETDPDVLRAMWKDAKSLPTDRIADVRALIEARVETVQAATESVDEAALDDAHAAELPLEGELVEDVA